jgi:four helix bundle protein
MKSENLVQEKSYLFALRIIRLYKYLVTRGEFVLSKQILRSGTSIGANVEEAIGCHSSRDFLAKFSIVYKEARETHYWLRLLKDSGYLSEKQAASILKDNEQLLKIIGSIQKTLKSKQIRNP